MPLKILSLGIALLLRPSDAVHGIEYFFLLAADLDADGISSEDIEFIGELVNRIPKLCRDYDVDPALVKIYSVEAAPAALPGSQGPPPARPEAGAGQAAQLEPGEALPWRMAGLREQAHPNH